MEHSCGPLKFPIPNEEQKLSQKTLAAKGTRDSLWEGGHEKTPRSDPGGRRVCMS